MIQSRELLPHFQVSTIDGLAVSYATIWQHRNLVLFALPRPEAADEAHYVAAVRERLSITAPDTECVVTTEEVPGVEAPAVVVADRWGEVHFARHAASVSELPPVDEIVEWLAYVQQRCPECEGEAR